MTDYDQAETVFHLLVFLTGLFGLLGGMGWLAEWLEKNVQWGKPERRQFGRFMDKRRM